MRPIFKVLAASFMLGMCSIGASHADVLNGSFETGDFSGWTLTGNAVVNPYYATDGQYSVHFNYANVAPTAVLSQTVATAPGHHYLLSFDFGVRSFSASTQTINVEVLGVAPTAYAATTTATGPPLTPR